MTLADTISLFRSFTGLFLGLTIFGLLVTPETETMVQLFRILSMLIFAVATLTPVSSYRDRLRYLYASIYIFGIIIAIPLILQAYNREVSGPDYAVMIFRFLQIELFIIFTLISVNSATSSIKSRSDIFH